MSLIFDENQTNVENHVTFTLYSYFNNAACLFFLSTYTRNINGKLEIYSLTVKLSGYIWFQLQTG